MSLVARSSRTASPPVGTHPSLALVRHAQRRCEIKPQRHARIQRVLACLVIPTAIFLAAALLVGPRCMCLGGESRVGTTHKKLGQYGHDAYPAWSADHPDRTCPDSLRDLDDYMNTADDRDAWGTPLEFRCDHASRDVTQRLRITSAGEDGVFGTEDDLHFPSTPRS